MIGDLTFYVFLARDPLGPRRPLNYRICGLDNVKLTVESQRHDVVAHSRTCTILDDSAQTISSHSRQIISRLHSIKVYFDLLSFTDFKFDAHRVLHEVQEFLLQVGWDTRSGPGRLVEDLQSIPKRLNSLNHAVAECEGLDTAVAHVSLSLRCVHLEGQTVRASEIEDLEVLDLSIRKHDHIVAQSLLWFRSRD